jgi:hypothetical protein
VTLAGNAPAHQEADLELAQVMAHLADRVLVRQAEWLAERTLVEDDIAASIRTSYRAAPSPIACASAAAPASVDTVEKWQGLQIADLGRAPPALPVGTAGAFDLEAGRWCVSLSRHQIAVSSSRARASPT